MPAVPSHALQLADPTGPSGREDNRFTESRADDLLVGEGAVYLPAVLCQCVPNVQRSIRPRAFLAQARKATFACHALR